MLRCGRRQFLRVSAAALAAGVLHAQNDSARRVRDIVDANHILYAKGIVDGFGHISVRTAPSSDHFYLARSLAPAQVDAIDILEYDLDAKPTPGETRTGYQERFIHSEIYRARQDVASLIHCHTPSLIPFGIVGEPLRPVFHNSSFVGEGIPVFEIRDAGGDATDMLVSNPELGRALARTLGNKPALLMRGHGAVIVGRSVEEAVARAIYLDLNAQLQAQAMALGRNITYLSEGEVKARSGDGNYTRAWELWKSEVSSGRR